jgi:hypothetical protein
MGRQSTAQASRNRELLRRGLNSVPQILPGVKILAGSKRHEGLPPGHDEDLFLAVARERYEF